MKKTILISSLFFLSGIIAHSQCEINLMLSVDSPSCFGESLETIVVEEMMNCENAVTSTYYWELSQNGNLVASANTIMATYNGFVLQNSDPYEICVTTTAFDNMGNVLTVATACDNVSSPDPISACLMEITQPTSCNDGGCANVQICGGVGGYAVTVDGQFAFLTQENYLYPQCNYPVGIYTIEVVDNNGCLFADDFTIVEYSTDNVQGKVYFDSNNDGEVDYGVYSEPGLANQEIYIVEADLTVFTDSEGAFIIDDIPAGTYTIEWIDNSDVYSISPNFNTQVELPACLEIPLVSDGEYTFWASGTGSIFNQTLHCTNGSNRGIWVQNTGSTVLNGTVVMTFDELLTAENVDFAEPFSDYSPGQVTWNITNQLPGTSVLYVCHINGPGADYVGQSFLFNTQLQLVDENDVVVFDEVWTNEPTVLCAYDPNDKYAEPAGYTEEHFITADQEIEYRIRFQNTGNLAAETIYVEDQLDLSVLDLSTFYPVVGSHNFYTVKQNDGLVRFQFDNIMLPPASEDEPASQGFVVFRIKPYEDIESFTPIYNTAQIYFDENPPIITNTYLHTIFECGNPAILPTTDDQCEGLPYVSEPQMMYYENFNWYVDDEYYADTPYFVYESENEDTLQVTLEMSNPICTGTNEMELVIHDAPEGELTIDGNILTAASDATTWYWYVNGEPVEGVNAQTFTATVSGTYQVVAANEWGCNTTSNVINYTDINEENRTRIVLYPNPITDESVIYLGQGTYQISIFDASGRLVSTHFSVQNQFVVQRSDYESGMYTILVEGNGRIENVRMSVE